MARPIKEGLYYFSLDTDFFQNIKVRKVKKRHGPAAIAVLLCVLCNIYRNKGYYIIWDDDFAFIISEEVGLTESQVKEVLNTCLLTDFFCIHIWEKTGALTSEEIQKRYLKVCLDSKRKGAEIKDCYKIKNEFTPVITELTQEETGLLPEETPIIPEETTQRKEKKIKGKNSIDSAAKKLPLYWPKIVDAWFDFYGQKFTDNSGQPKKPIFTAVHGSHLKKIGGHLKKICESKGKTWDEETARKYHLHFFNTAWKHDDWLKENFELSNLLSKFNSIVNTTKNATNDNSAKIGTSAARIEAAKNLKLPDHIRASYEAANGQSGATRIEFPNP